MQIRRPLNIIVNDYTLDDQDRLKRFDKDNSIQLN